MNIPFHHPSAILAIALGVSMVISSIIQWSFLIGLRKKHKEQWIHAGSPTIWSDQSLMSAWPTVRYMKNKKYLDSYNELGIKFCHMYRVPFIFLYWSTVISFVLLMLSIFIFGWPKEWQ